MSLNWKKLLPGGFAFETANFGVHPLDARRAREAFMHAKRAGASLDDVVEHARGYLKEKGYHPVSAEEQLERVRRLWNKVFQVRKKSAWVVAWTGGWEGEHIPSAKAIAILDSRKTIDRVMEFMSAFYLATCARLEEKIHFASHAKDVPDQVRWDAGERCLKLGNDPLMIAFVADNVWTSDDELRFERRI